MQPLWTDQIDTVAHKIMPPDYPIVWMGVHSAHDLPTKTDILGACWAWCGKASDQLYGAAFVANTDTKDEDGDHWVVFYFPSPYHKNRTYGAYFFDPLGRSPLDNGHAEWEELLSSWSTDAWEYNQVHIQEIGANCCGQLCLLWLFYMTGRRGFPLGCGTPTTVVQTHFNNMLYAPSPYRRPRQNVYVRSPLLNVCPGHYIN